MVLNIIISGSEHVIVTVWPLHSNQSGNFEIAPIRQRDDSLDQHCISAFGIVMPKPSGYPRQAIDKVIASFLELISMVTRSRVPGAIDGHQGRTDRPMSLRSRLG
jgi:hypothetical protein